MGRVRRVLLHRNPDQRSYAVPVRLRRDLSDKGTLWGLVSAPPSRFGEILDSSAKNCVTGVVRPVCLCTPVESTCPLDPSQVRGHDALSHTNRGSGNNLYRSDKRALTGGPVTREWDWCVGRGVVGTVGDRSVHGPRLSYLMRGLVLSVDC